MRHLPSCGRDGRSPFSAAVMSVAFSDPLRILHSYQRKMFQCDLFRLRQTDPRSSAGTTRCVEACNQFRTSIIDRSSPRIGCRLRLDDSARTRLHRSAAKNPLPGALALPHPGPRLARYQVRPFFLHPSSLHWLTRTHSRSRRQLATCSADTTIKIWTPTGLPTALDGSPLPGRGGIADGTGYQLDKVLQGHQRWVWDMAYSADSAYLVSGALRHLSHAFGSDLAMYLRARTDGDFLCRAASSDHTARLWELASGTTVRQVRLAARLFQLFIPCSSLHSCCSFDQRAPSDAFAFARSTRRITRLPCVSRSTTALRSCSLCSDCACNCHDF